MGRKQYKVPEGCNPFIKHNDYNDKFVDGMLTVVGCHRRFVQPRRYAEREWEERIEQRKREPR